MFCLAASAMREGTEYIAVILHDDTSQRRFDDARKLLDYAFANYALVTPAAEALPRVRVRLGEADSVALEQRESCRVLVKREEAEQVTAQVETVEETDAPVEAGQELGRLTLSVNGKAVRTLPLTAARDVERLNFWSVLRRLWAAALVES
jgi:D-alanyl-D-alanine carboxypeptidase (penicillin-binding protein 5/6)